MSMYNFRGQTRFIMGDTQIVNPTSNLQKELLSHGFIFYINVDIYNILLIFNSSFLG